MRIKTVALSLVLLASACFLTACDNAKKMGADSAIKAADAALAPILPEAQKYVPDQAKAMTDSLQQAKTSFANGDYSAALDQAKGLPDQAKALADALKAKKDELTAKFTEMSSSMPGLVAAAQTKFDALKKSHKLPDGANGVLDTVKQSWADASTSMQSGDLASAMDKATATKAKLGELQAMLGIKPVA